MWRSRSSEARLAIDPVNSREHVSFRPPPLRARILFLALLLAWPEAAIAAPTAEKLMDAVGGAGDAFGMAVALDGSHAIVGAPGDATMGADAGKAVIYFYDGIGWSEQASLFPTVSPTAARFGESVALSGSYAVVGSPYLPGGSSEGRVYVYERTGSTWSPHAVLSGPGTSLDDHFGAAVAIAGLDLLIGAPGHDDGQSDSGAVHAYERSGALWSYVNRVDNPHSAFQKSFGRAIDVDPSWTVVGSLPRGNNLGWVYVLDRPVSDWVFHSNFRPTGSAVDDDLGASVAVSGDQTMASALGHSAYTNLAEGAGFAFELVLGNWIQTGVFVEAPGTTTSMAVGLDGDLAAVGKDNDFILTPGAVFLHRRATNGQWIPVAVVQPTDGLTAVEAFGSSVSVSNDCVLAGAPNDSEKGVQAGAAWIFCQIPQLAVLVSLDIICCEYIPDYTTAPVEFEIDWENITAVAMGVMRSVRLERPDGSQVDLVDPVQVDLGPGSTLVEPFSIDLTPHVEDLEGGAEGDYALVLEWTDAEGNDLEEIQFFTLGTAPAVPMLAAQTVLLLACALGAAGLLEVHARRQRARDPSPRDRA